jgi:hypothetical protein
MTQNEFLKDHKTKLLGTLTTVIATLLSMIALGMFDADMTSPALLEPTTVKWMTVVLSLLNVVLGGGTVAAGLSNTTQERVAASAATIEVAKAEQAQAMEVALNTPVTEGPIA